MTQNYIGINGLVTQDLASIKNDLVSKAKDIYGQSINVEQNSPDGQWINIWAQEKKDALDLAATIYNNLDVDRVVGIPQQILYKLNGLTINAYTYSYVYINVLTSIDVTLQGLDENIENADGVGYTVRLFSIRSYRTSSEARRTSALSRREKANERSPLSSIETNARVVNASGSVTSPEASTPSLVRVRRR